MEGSVNKMASSLPETLSHCILKLPNDAGFLQFMRESSTVQIGGVVSSFQYTRNEGGKDAVIEIVPIGGSLGGNCTVRHELSLLSQRTDANSVTFLVQDKGTLFPCSTQNRKIISPILKASVEATLSCQLLSKA